MRGDQVSPAGRALIERACAAIDVTPLSVAAAEGLDSRAVARLRRGQGDAGRARALAAALRRNSAELRALAAELTAAASQS